MFTGSAFPNAATATTDQKVAAAQAYLNKLSVDDRASVYRKYMTTPDDATLDAALKANADAAGGKAEAETVTAIAQTIASSKICRAKFGTYTGTGLSGQNHPNSVECGFCPALLVLFRADGGQKTTVIRGVTACSSGIGSMNNYYTWGDSGVSWVSETLQSDSGGYMASSQFNSSGKEYCYLVLGYDADWIKQKTAPSLSARGCFCCQSRSRTRRLTNVV